MDRKVEESFALESNLERRIKNFALGPSTPSNALVPIFEALYNSIHAVEERFKIDWQKNSTITVEFVHERQGRSVHAIITDNGIGINEANFLSFRTYDSGYKSKKGGKGVGRLSWLKVFDHAEVTSVFEVGGRLELREFNLVLDNSAPISHHKLSPAPHSEPGTAVKLVEMKSEYEAHLPAKNETILKKIVAHFISFFLSDKSPRIKVSFPDGESCDLREFVENSRLSLGSNEFSVTVFEKNTETNVFGPFTVSHNLLERGITEGGASHKIYYTANGRVVREVDITTAIGLPTYIDRSGSKYSYAGVVSSTFLDNNVSSERTIFDFELRLFDALNSKAIEFAKVALDREIGKVIDRQASLTQAVLKKYPRYSYLVADSVDFARDDLPRNFRTAEQVYQHLSVHDFREHRSMERRIEAASKEGGDGEEIVNAGVKEILDKLTEQEFSVLADYTVRRKVLLDLLERRLGFKPDGEMKHEAEAALHQFVVPMRVDKSDVHIDKHNLWILDDKLTYYEHWASDKQTKKLIADSDSASRPDVILFGGRTVFHRPGTDQPIMMIEFKRPARDDYSDDENPFTQIYGYIDDLRGGRVLDKNGAVIQEVSENTPFFCYIVADLTPKLRSWLRMAQINVPLPGGSGFYGYNAEYKAFVQAVSYKYVVKDARLRNEAFFKRLQI